MSDIEDNDSRQASAAPEDDDVQAGGNDDDAMSDRDSDILSDVDVGDLEEYDPLKARIEQRPVDIDEDVAKSLKATKRKRAEGETTKKPKEGRRPKKRRAEDGDEVSAADGTIIEGKRRRAGAGTGGGGEKKAKSRSKRPTPEPENDEHLTPEQRRARAIEKAMDAAIKGKSNKRRTKKDEVDLEEELDDIIADLKVRMETACQEDNLARDDDRAAVAKMKLLPEVMTLLNRQHIQHAILDPETNFLQAVKYFLEPLRADGSLPAYNIQREIFTALTKMPIEKEALSSSGIGQVVLFYTKTKRAQPEIKRMAERLMGEWSRPILQRTDDYKKRQIEARYIDPDALKYRGPGSQSAPSSQQSLAHRPGNSGKKQSSVSERLAAKRAAALEPVRANPNRARPAGMPVSYTIAPISQLGSGSGPDHRPVGAGSMEAFRKITQGKKKS